MKLTEDNYYSQESSKEYFSVSQFKDFMKCEAMAKAKIDGLYKQSITRPLLIGSFIDAYYEGTLQTFKNENPEIFTQKNELRAEFKKANDIIKRLNSDERFQYYMSGEKQKIIIFDLFGQMWKAKLDSYLEGTAIVDLKIVATYKNLHYWRYDIQGAAYQKAVESLDGSLNPFYLAVATKERVTNFDIFHLPQRVLDDALLEIEIRLPRFVEVKTGLVEPVRCEECDYCKSTKKSRVRSYIELM